MTTTIDTIKNELEDALRGAERLTGSSVEQRYAAAFGYLAGATSAALRAMEKVAPETTQARNSLEHTRQTIADCQRILTELGVDDTPGVNIRDRIRALGQRGAENSARRLLAEVCRVLGVTSTDEDLIARVRELVQENADRAKIMGERGRLLDEICDAIGGSHNWVTLGQRVRALVKAADGGHRLEGLLASRSRIRRALGLPEQGGPATADAVEAFVERHKGGDAMLQARGKLLDEIASAVGNPVTWVDLDQRVRDAVQGRKHYHKLTVELEDMLTAIAQALGGCLWHQIVDRVRALRDAPPRDVKVEIENGAAVVKVNGQTVAGIRGTTKLEINR